MSEVTGVKVENVLESLRERNLTKVRLEDSFVENHFQPLADRMPLRFIFTLVAVLVVFNLFAILALVVVYKWLPKRARENRPPPNATPEQWVGYAEKNLRYHNHGAIVEGYETALALVPDHTVGLVRYGQYLANRAIQYKPAPGGDPKGWPADVQPNKAFDLLRQGVEQWDHQNPNKPFHPPLNLNKVEPIHSVLAWLAMDLRRYPLALKNAQIGLTLDEFQTSNNKKLQDLELRIVLAVSAAQSDSWDVFFEQVQHVVQSVGRSLHPAKAQSWELLGEVCQEAKLTLQAETCFREAVHLDRRRWISAHRLYLFYKKTNKTAEAEYYQEIYLRAQRVLRPD